MPDVVTIDGERHDAVLFDLDGVVTDTASVHAAAWKALFDEFLRRRPEAAGEDHGPFTDDEYRRYVDGKARHDGIESFLGSRGISLPVGDPSDPPDEDTVHGLGARKDGYFRDRLERDGVEVFGSTVVLVRRLQEVGIGTAIFSASRNCQRVLAVAGLDHLFEVRVDGVVADELDLPGKPDPAVLLEAAGRLGIPPGRAVIVEDSTAGVEAGRRGGFALVVGVDRHGDPRRLRDAGADGVVTDLAEVRLRAPGRPRSAGPESRR